MKKYLPLLVLVLIVLIIPITLYSVHQKQQLQNFAAAPTQPVGQTGTWDILFEDGFDGPRVDTSKWSFISSAESNCDQNGCSNPGNQQLEYNQGANCTITGGILTITAKRETAGGRDWTSCMIHSKPQFQTMYLEARAKLPAQKGFWPGFWTWNSPADEVDVFEYYSDNKTKLYLSDHTGGGGGCDYNTTFDPTADFHTYAAYMDGRSITWYIDGKSVCNTQGSPHQPASILLDMFVYSQIPPDPTTNAETMQVDYIKAWQKTSNGNPSPSPQPTNITPTLYCLGGCPTLPVSTIPSNPIVSSGPTNSVSNIPSPSQQQITPSPIPTTTIQPCPATGQTISTKSDDDDKKRKNNRQGGFLSGFFEFLFKLIQLLLQIFGGIRPCTQATNGNVATMTPSQSWIKLHS